MSNRKVILKMVISLDGFATSPDGTHEWMFEWFGEDSTEWNLRALEEAGVHAMGRRSYDIMGPHWAASEGPVATAMNEKPKAVFSHTLENAEWGPAEIFGGDLSADIADLKARDDEGTVLVHGGPDFAQSLTRLDLVDEFLRRFLLAGARREQDGRQGHQAQTAEAIASLHGNSNSGN